MSDNEENPEERDRFGDLLDRGAQVAHRVGLKSLWRELSARSSQRFIERYHRGGHDDAENARTSPPDDEHIELLSVWVVEVFPPSSSSDLYAALRRLPDGGIFRQQDLAEEVARHRRYPRGGAWWNLGTFYRPDDRRVPGVGRIDLPSHIDHVFVELHMATPSLACVVGQFVLTDDSASRLEAILRTRYETKGIRNADGSVSERTPLFAKREDVAAAFDQLHDACKAWFVANFPGAFCGGLLDGYLPACYFLTLDGVRPFSDEARLEYLDPLGVDATYYALESDELPGLRLSSPTRVDPRPHTFLLAGKRTEVFAGNDLGGHERNRFGFTVALNRRLARFMAVWGFERALLGYEMAFARLRDSLARPESRSIKQNLKELSVASRNVATLGGDAQAIAADAGRLAGDERAFKRNLIEFDPVAPELWRIEGTWTDAVLRADVALSADRLAAVEATTRDLEVTRASIVSSRTNLVLQGSLRRLTWFLLVLTVVLVAIGWATLKATS
jgi:hypothetical protein